MQGTLIARSLDRSHYLLFRDSATWDLFIDLLEEWGLFDRMEYDLNPPAKGVRERLESTGRILGPGDISAFRSELARADSINLTVRSFVRRWRVDGE